MRKFAFFVFALVAQPAEANDWEKFFVAVPQEGAIDATTAPEILQSSGDLSRDLEGMFRRGFVPVGYSSFNAPNSKTKDGQRLAEKIHARYLIVATNLTSQRTGVIPLSTPTATTSYTRGVATAYGGGQSATGTYSGVTTTFGTQTNLVPFSVSRFDKTAVYFKEIPRKGAGLKIRDLTNEEMIAIGTRHALAVQFVRDNSPAYEADIFPGDIITLVNGELADAQHWRAAVNGPQPMQVHILRDRSAKDIKINIPPQWQGLP
ncbi:UNVERIFIED_ORG: hypothetical protein ABIC34_003869 [Sphingomonas sp. 1057]